MHQITLIPGDGVGPEVMQATTQVIEASGVEIEWEVVNAGEEVLRSNGTPLPTSVLEAIRRNKVALKGPITTPIGSGFRSVNVAIRKELDLYAGVRPARSFQGVNSPYKDVDLVVIRENTEGLYSGVEHFIDKERSAAESVRVITRRASERIVRFAFEYAVREGRKKVTVVHKANILKATDGLFLEVAKDVASSYPQIDFEEKLIDNMAMQLVKNPHLYDVLVAPNLYGDILSDLCSGLVGGLGLAPGANIGKEFAVFEPVHGSVPKYAGADRVNPTAAILSGVLMLKHIGEFEAAERIVHALEVVIEKGETVTYDLGGKSTTSDMVKAIIDRL